MPRILIPSDNRDFIFYLAKAYQEAGWDVVVGASNFDLGGTEFDVVHFQWPEELSGWKPPGDARLAEIIDQLARWRQRSRLVMTSHNLYPHVNGGAPNYRKLYDAFFESVQMVTHFTAASRDAIVKEYPSAAKAQHVVTGFYNLDVLLPPVRDPDRARRELGISTDDFVVLIFGALREWAEVDLFMKGFDGAAVPGKRLLMCGRYQEGGSLWRRRWRRLILSRWLRSRKAIVASGFIPDNEVHRMADAANAVLIPHFRSMNSGLPALGASFGKIIIAPRCGSSPELLTNTSHPIFEPGNAESLSRALETAAKLDRAVIESDCRRLATEWQWSTIVRTIAPPLDASKKSLGKEAAAKSVPRQRKSAK